MLLGRIGASRVIDATHSEVVLGNGTSPVPCAWARQNGTPVVTCAHEEKSKELDGRTVSPGYCMLVCKAYEGPRRTPELIQQVSGISVKGMPLVNDTTSQSAAPAPRPTLKQIKSWLAAEWSLLKQGPVPVAVFNERMSHCMACPHRVVDRADDPGYCDQCGCGGNDRARLATKLHMPKAACPAGHWSNDCGEGRQHLQRLGGVAQQVRAQWTQATRSLWSSVLPFAESERS